MLLWLMACVPVPYLLPPTDFSASIDPRPVVERVDDVAVPHGPEAVDLRAGIVPLSVIPELSRRKIDPSAGFVAVIRHPAFGNTLDYGGYGRVAYRAWRDDLAGETFLAVEPRATVDVLSVDLDGPGRATSFGGTLGVAFRVGGRCDSDVDHPCIQGGWNAIGVGWGEWGLALALDAGVEGRPHGMAERLLLSLELRAPAGVGVVLVPVPLR